jgi:integrase
MAERAKRASRKQHKTHPGSIFRPAKVNTLYIKWRGVQESTGLPDTPKNRQILQNLLIDRWRIERGLRPDFIMQAQERDELLLTWDEVIPRFEEHLQSIDATDKTRKSYVRAVNAIISDRLTPVSAQSVERHIRRWLATTTDMTAASVNNYLRSMRVFANWCHRQKVLHDPIDVSQFMRKGEAQEILIYSDKECATIIAYFAARDKEFALLIEFLLATGFRINEALRLEWASVKDDVIVVPNKITRTPEQFPITQHIRSILDRLPRKAGSTTKVFRWTYSNTNRLTKRLRDGIAACGIDPRGGWHTFRRTFQDVLYRRGIDMADRQRLMRHRSITTTIQSYTYTDQDRLRTVLEQTETSEPTNTPNHTP